MEKRELPEEIAVQLENASQTYDVDYMVAEYEEKQRERFEKRLADRIERFSEKLKEKGAADHEVLVRQILVSNLREELRAKRAAIKQLREEIKALRGASKVERKKKSAEDKAVKAARAASKGKKKSAA